MKEAWRPESWRTRTVHQMPVYEDGTAIAEVEAGSMLESENSGGRFGFGGADLQRKLKDVSLLVTKYKF